MVFLESHVSASPENCFDLARSVEVHVASTEPSGERPVAGVTSGLLGPGDEVTWEARHFGIRFRMTARITHFDSPRCFVDEQVRGPFTFWWHQHTFQPLGNGTRMIDVARYAVPFGLVGRVVDQLFLNRYMKALLKRRSRYVKQVAEGTGPSSY